MSLTKYLLDGRLAVTEVIVLDGDNVKSGYSVKLRDVYLGDGHVPVFDTPEEAMAHGRKIKDQLRAGNK